jgi:hypothetical protein
MKEKSLSKKQSSSHSLFLEIGILWLTDKGTLSGVINLEPIVWRNPETSRKITISPLRGMKINHEIT